MKILISLIFSSVLLFVGAAHSDTYCARPSAQGDGEGEDWANAIALSTVVASSIYRGDTIYISGESYGSVTFSAPESESTLVTIKKATASDHVTDEGWNATWGTTSATFTHWGFTTGYWKLDGQTGQGADTLYGVADSSGWMDYVEHGFKVKACGSQDLINPEGDNITIEHTEAGYTCTPGNAGSWGDGADIIQDVVPGNDSLTLSYCWLHDASRVHIAAQDASNMLIEYSVLERCGMAEQAGTNDEHTELISWQNGVTNATVRYSFLRDWQSTGGLILHSEVGTPPSINVRIYGNVFTLTGYFGTTYGPSNGVIGALNKAPNGSHTLYVYNNTFVNLFSGCFIGGGQGYGVRQTYNNIFYDCNYWTYDDKEYAIVYGTVGYN